MTGGARRSPAPLGFAVAVAVGLTLAAAPARAFDYYEHVYLGQLVCEATKGFTWPDGTTPLACLEKADDIAIAGDHAQDIGELDDARADQARKAQVTRQLQEVYAWLAASRRSWNDLRKSDATLLRQIISAGSVEQQLEQLASELKVEISARPPRSPSPDDLHPSAPALLDAEQNRRPACFSPSKSLEDGFAGLAGYVQLATGNNSHFGWEAQSEFLKYADPEKFKPANTDARAFAFHYLTDSYAAGHVRTERGALAPFAAKVAHDWDNRNGLDVGQSFFVVNRKLPQRQYVLFWRAYGDRCLLSDEGRATRILAAFAMIHASPSEPASSAPPTAAPPTAAPPPAGGETLTWNRPIALTRNDPPIAEYREHFKGVLGAGSLVPFETDGLGPTPMLRARFELEYYTPMSEAVMLAGSLQLNASRQIVLIPVGLGYHWPNFLAKAGPALRWATDRDFFEIGLEGEAGWCWAPFPTMELRLVGVATPFVNLQRATSELSMRQDLSLFVEVSYRLDR